MRYARILLLAASMVPGASAAYPMDFQLEGTVVFASGEIFPGDAAKFSNFLHANKVVSDYMQSYSVRLSSLGGNLLEGMALGTTIRRAEMSTVIARGDICASACALAFLGGIQAGVSSDAIGRRLEFGGSLGFHGFRVEAEKLSFQNETLEMSRVIAALILSYAEEMKGVDLGWLSRTLNVSANDIFLVRRPKDLLALSITVTGMPSVIPKDWFLNVCRNLVGQNTPKIDSFKERVTSQSSVIPTIKALRRAIVTGRYGSDPVVSILDHLSDSDAIDFVLGGSFYLDQRKPILDARIITLERGAGFYFDQCLAVRSKGQAAAIMTDSVGKRVVYKNFDDDRQQLSMFPDDTELW